jgi:hypothetical protein
MNDKIADVNAQTERNRVKCSDFDSAARDFLQLCDDAAADRLLEGIRRDVPAEQAQHNQTESAEPQEKLPPDPAPGRRRLTQRF